MRNKAIIENIKPYRDDRAIKSAGAIRHFLDPLDKPQFCLPAQANHMRDDDYVIGLPFEHSARAYPTWIIDYYHVVNDHLENEPFAVFS